MINFLKSYCNNIPGTTFKIDKMGNLYITKGDADTYPCVVAHMDQVQKDHPDDFYVIETKELLLGYSRKERRQCGLGADDKNGIWIALKCLRKYDFLKCAFFVGEEIGCIGSDKADLEFFIDCRFVLQCDRKGKSDFITNISGTELCSVDFIKDCNLSKYGYKTANGLMTDVDALKENELAVSCCNISCGYYNAHTDEEITVKSDLWNCLNLVCNIIETCAKVYPHEYHYTYTPSGYYCRSWNKPIDTRQAQKDELYSELWDIIELNPNAYTANEIKSWYRQAFPALSDSDFEEIFTTVCDEVQSYKIYESDHRGII